MLSLLITDLLMVLSILLLSVFMELTLLLLWICYQFQLSQELSFEANIRAKEMKKLYEQIRGQIERTNEAYKAKGNNNRK